MKKRMKDFEDLLKPFKIENKLTLKNRIVMAPMTRNFTENGIPDEKLMRFYTERAKHGVGLLIVGPIAVSHPSTITEEKMFDLSSEEKINAWKTILNEIHKYGAKVFAQIWHVGHDRVIEKSPYPLIKNIVPSQSNIPNYATKNEIEKVIDAFVKTAQILKVIGFDGVEIHGAHGYLIDEFLWQKTNFRTDEFGGNIINRTRFASNIIKKLEKK